MRAGLQKVATGAQRVRPAVAGHHAVVGHREGLVPGTQELLDEQRAVVADRDDPAELPAQQPGAGDDPHGLAARTEVGLDDDRAERLQRAAHGFAQVRPLSRATYGAGPGELEGRALRPGRLEVLPGQHLGIQPPGGFEVTARGHPVDDRAPGVLADEGGQAAVLGRGAKRLDRYRPVGRAVIQRFDHTGERAFIGDQVRAEGVAGLASGHGGALQVLIAENNAEIGNMCVIHRMPGYHDLVVARPVQSHFFFGEGLAGRQGRELRKRLPLRLLCPLENVAEDKPVKSWLSRRSRPRAHPSMVGK